VGAARHGEERAKAWEEFSAEGPEAPTNEGVLS
jgi:hypothetical protein